MIAFLKTLPGKLVLIFVGLVFLASLCLCGYTLWHYQQPKFQNVTIELGQEMPAIDAFLTCYATPAKAKLVTSPPELSAAGEYPLEFAYGKKISGVTLTVTDTVSPTATFQNLTVDLEVQLKPEDFVVKVFDLAQTTVTFAAPYELPTQPGERFLDVLVTDASGNKTTGTCTVTYVWIKETLAVELGHTVTIEDILLNPQRDGHMLDQTQLDEINATGIGEYTVSSIGQWEGVCNISVQDTTPPELTLKEVSVMVGSKVKNDQFIKSCTDASGEVVTTVSGVPDCKTKGDYTITVEAVDPSGNKTTATTKLSVTGDKKAPVFSGLKAMEVKKDSSPNWKSGVKAKDNIDGTVEFTVDTSKVNLSKAGTYYATYTAVDSAGNKATARRKVVVGHSDEDTKALVKSTAANLPSNAVDIAMWVRKKVRYNTNWGGNDPIWYGLKNKVGNCYVHAKILEAFLKEKGYQTKLIWVTDKSHYWNLVNIGGKWYHIDSTPGTKHPSRLMDDADRYANLQGRDWDRSQWPACN